MAGDAEEYALEILGRYNEARWPKWKDETTGTGDAATTTVGLKNIVEKYFRRGDHPEMFLKQLEELKQGTKDMENFLTEFENLKILVKISNDHTKDILQQGVKWSSMERFVELYSPSADYAGLKCNLVEIGEAKQYLKAIKHPEHHNHYYIPETPKLKTTPCYLSGQGPMDVDPQQKGRRTCYNCGKVGHVAKKYQVLKKICNLPSIPTLKELPDQLRKDIAKMEAEIASLKKKLTRRVAKGKAKEESISEAEEDFPDNE